METFIFAVIILAFGVWGMKWLSSSTLGGGLLQSFTPKIWNKIFNSEKRSGARFQGEQESSGLLNSRNTGVVLDGEGRKRLSLNDSFQHIAIISPTGAGKTTRYVAPNLLTLDDCSIIVTDPSGELYQKTSGAMRQRG